MRAAFLPIADASDRSFSLVFETKNASHQTDDFDVYGRLPRTTRLLFAFCGILRLPVPWSY